MECSNCMMVVQERSSGENFGVVKFIDEYRFMLAGKDGRIFPAEIHKFLLVSPRVSEYGDTSSQKKTQKQIKDFTRGPKRTSKDELK